MEQALSEMVLPKAVTKRRNDSSGYTADLILTAAVVYAKIAWRHGFNVRVPSPYIPAEWLPVAPLSTYPAPYPFPTEPIG